MLLELDYEGYVYVKEGEYKGFNGLKVGYCVNYLTREWMCLVQFYVEGDVEAIPFEMIEKAHITRI
jgi:hypothetical protein